MVFVAGKITGELGGGREAQILAALDTLFSVGFAEASIFSMEVLDMLWWSLLAYILIRIIKRDEPRLWLLFGRIAGIGLTTKLTLPFFLFALVIALSLTS